MNERVSTLELFFDLGFVFTITQVARLVSHALGTSIGEDRRPWSR